MYQSTVFFPSDARKHTQWYHNGWLQDTLRHQSDEKVVIPLADGAHRLRLASYQEHHSGDNKKLSELSAAKRARSVTLEFTTTISGKAVLSQLKKRGVKGRAPAPMIKAAFDGPSLQSQLANLMHQHAHAARFQTAFLVSMHQREVGLTGVSPAVGACSAQVLFKDCVFDKNRCKIMPSFDKKPARWKTYLRPHVLRAQRQSGKSEVLSYAVKISPNVCERTPPGQVPLYSATAGLDIRLLQHMDAGSLGLDNFVVNNVQGASCIRIPELDESSSELVCDDSLQWFTMQALAQMYQPKDLQSKLEMPQAVNTRRNELDRFSQATISNQPFVPRSHMPMVAPTEVGPQVAMDPEREDMHLMPVTKIELDRAYELFYKQVVCANRGIVDFSKGVRAVFEPFDPQAWQQHVQPTDQITVTLAVDLLYVPLMNWLDVKTASAVDSGAGDEDEEDKEDEDNAVAEEESDDDDDDVLLSPVVSDDEKEAEEASLPPPPPAQSLAGNNSV